MKRLPSYLMVIAAVVAALAAVPTVQAGDPNSAAVRAIMLRSQELGRLCQNPTLSRALYLGHCGPSVQAGGPNAAAVRAMVLRTEELGRLCQDTTVWRQL